MWFRIKALFAHSRTVFAARATQAAGAIVVAHDGIAMAFVGQDFTPISTRLMDALHVAQDLRTLVWGAIVMGIGGLFKWLRSITTQSLDENKADAEVAAVAADAGIPSPPAPPTNLQP